MENKRPDKVVITITPDNYTTDVFNEDDEFLSSRRAKMVTCWESKHAKEGDIFLDLDDEYDDIAERIDNVSLQLFSIAGALCKARELDEDGWVFIGRNNG